MRRGERESASRRQTWRLRRCSVVLSHKPRDCFGGSENPDDVDLFFGGTENSSRPAFHRPPHDFASLQMDLDALRKAALSSKKRKLAAHLSNGPAPGNDSEKEEGEIDDDEEHVQPVDRVALDTSPAHDPAACAFPSFSRAVTRTC